MERKAFGILPDGRTVEELTIHGGGLTASVLTWGGILRTLWVPTKDGSTVDVLLGMDTVGDYLQQDKYLGALIGRYANRIGGASFDLGGKIYPLAANDGPNSLHGGPGGFDRQMWTVENQTEDSVTLTLESPDGQEGYPGNLSVRVVYLLDGDGLHIRYEVKTDGDTICNLTNHAYFNLSGHSSGPVTDQEIQIFADRYTPTLPGSIPTGEIAPVDGTPMDLRVSQPMGLHADDEFAQLKLAGGYDHNWVINGYDGTLRPAARAVSHQTGVVLETLTTLPGIQFYGGNYLDHCPRGKGGAPYAARWGFCLETQFFPDSPNHPEWGDVLLRPGGRYDHTTEYRFRAD